MRTPKFWARKKREGLTKDHFLHFSRSLLVYDLITLPTTYTIL